MILIISASIVFIGIIFLTLPKKLFNDQDMRWNFRAMGTVFIIASAVLGFLMAGNIIAVGTKSEYIKNIHYEKTNDRIIFLMPDGKEFEKKEVNFFNFDSSKQMIKYSYDYNSYGSIVRLSEELLIVNK
jgi:hypothetical protein